MGNISRDREVGGREEKRRKKEYRNIFQLKHGGASVRRLFAFMDTNVGYVELLKIYRFITCSTTEMVNQFLDTNILQKIYGSYVKLITPKENILHGR